MKNRFHFLFILLPLLLIVGLIIFLVLRIGSFINPVTIDTEITEEDIAAYEDNYDVIRPLLDEEGYVVMREIKNILIFGNAPFAEDRTSDEGMANMLAASTGANIINCAIDGTYACQVNEADVLENPLDIYTPYYLCTYLTFPGYIEENILNGAALLGDSNPKEAADVLDTLSSLDMEEIDLIVYFYDLTDYYLEHPIYKDGESVSAETFGGNIYLAMDIINTRYPHIRQICMSPYYNSFTDADGNTESAELHKNKYGTPGEYVLSEGGPVQIYTMESFVDNYFGSITEVNCDKYLKDPRHLNAEGRKLLVKRLTDAIFYFSNPAGMDQ